MSYTRKHDDLVYSVPRWDAYLYKQRRAATSEAEGMLTEPMRADENLREAEQAQVETLASGIGRELFSRMYGDPEVSEQPDAPRWLALAHEVLGELDEWEALRARVSRDADFSALATNCILRELAPRLEDLIKREQEEHEQQQGGQDGEDGAEGGGQQRGSGPGGLSARDVLRSALRGAARAAGEQVEEGRDALGGIAPGVDATPPEGQQRDLARFDLARAAMEDPDVREVAKRAGRVLRISSRSAERRRTREVREEVVDVERGSDVSRLLPSETMQLLDDDLEWLALSRIADGTALQYRLEGHEPQGRGPIVLLRDVSGSMDGDPHLWGAAVAVALTAQAAREDRSVTSAVFNSAVYYGRRFDSRGLHEYRTKNGKKIQGYRGTDAVPDRLPEPTLTYSGRMAQGQAALAHIRDGCMGGTDFSTPLAWALAAGVEEPRADFVFVTDGYADADEEQLLRLREAKRSGLRVFGILVNGGYVTDGVAEICDEVVNLDLLNPSDRASGLGKVLGRAR